MLNEKFTLQIIEHGSFERVKPSRAKNFVNKSKKNI